MALRKYLPGTEVNGFKFLKDAGYSGKRRIGLFVCRLCSKEFTALVENVSSGNTGSCGCNKYEPSRIKSLKHGHTVGYIETSEYGIWCAMKARCINKHTKTYESYGGRGITVCLRWTDPLNGFANFIKDMGLRPSKQHSIDRRDNDGNYEPTNCRWATDAEQRRNKRTNFIVEYKGRSMPLIDWSIFTQIKYAKLQNRISKLKWPLEKVFADSVVEIIPPEVKINYSFGHLN